MASEIDGRELVQMVKDAVKDLPTAKDRAAALIFITSDCTHMMTSRGVCGRCGLSPSAIPLAQKGESDVHK
jgi:hypothetical protein